MVIPLPALVSVLPTAPTMVTSSPSRIQTVPSPASTIQCQRDHGKRSIRAGMLVSICVLGASGAAVRCVVAMPGALPLLTARQSACRRISAECAIATRVGASHGGVGLPHRGSGPSREPGPSSEPGASDRPDGLASVLPDNASADHLGSECPPRGQAGGQARAHLPDLPVRARAGPSDTLASLRTRSERLTCPPEECESGRIGRSRKPLCLMGTVGSNPTSSARGRAGPSHLAKATEQRQGRRLAGNTWSSPAAGKE